MTKTKFNTNQTDNLLDKTILASPANSITVNFSASAKIKVVINIPSTNTAVFTNYVIYWRFNGDTGANYTYAIWVRGWSHSWANGATSFRLYSDGLAGSAGVNRTYIELTIENTATEKKIGMFTWVTRLTTDVVSIDWTMIWENSTNQITSINLYLPWAETFATGTYVEVYG